MRARRGATVLELAIALAIASLMCVTGYEALTTVIAHRQREQDAIADLRRAADTRRTLLAWLEGATVIERAGADFQGIHRENRGAPDDELLFLTTAPTALGDGYAIVRLFVDRDDATPERGLTAELRQWGGARISRIELDRDVVSLRIRYFTGLLGEAKWIDTWVSSSLVPQAVQLTLDTSRSRGATLHSLLALPITAGLEGGQ